MSRNYDIAVIGGGIAGLLNAAILSKEGYNVIVLEKHHTMGGALQSFKRDGICFDTGMHYFGNFDKGQQLHKIFSYLGIYDSLKVQKLDEHGFDKFFLGDKVYSYAQGFSNFENTLIGSFPNEQKGICAYVDELQKLVASIDLYSLNLVKHNSIFNTEHFSQSLSQVLQKVTDNPLLQQVLSGLNFLHGGTQEKTFWYVHAIINHHYINSAYRFVGGSQQLVDALVAAIKSNGGEVVTKAQVNKFIFEGKDVVALKTVNGDEIRAKQYISSIHPSATMKLIPEDKIRKIYRNRLLAIENTKGSFTLYLRFKPKTFKYINSNYYFYDGESTWIGESQKLHNWPYGLGFYALADSENPEYSEGASVITYMDYAEVARWEGTKIEQRGDEYKTFKIKKAQRIIEKLEERFPGIKNNIASYYTATPLTWKDYTGVPGGSMYGMKREFGNEIEAYVYPGTHIKNLYLAGQSTYLHGLMGVSLGSILTASEFIGLEYLLKKINDV